MIEVQQISKTFGQVEAVKQLSFTARDGEITGLLGPNGAGKTTTLRMLYSLLPPDQGTIAVDGIGMTAGNHALRTHLGVVPDAKGLYQRLSARENIAYFGRLQGLTESQLQQRMGELIEMLGMQAFIDRRCGGFSQGQRVKTAIARALVHHPQNILLDEPSNGLDVMSTRALRGFIKQMRDAGRCVIFSSHIMQEVAALCDRIIIIAEGRVVAQGSPAQLLQQSAEENLEDAFVKIIGASAEGLLE
jgi:sodium transport system ATP-binding protein